MNKTYSQPLWILGLLLPFLFPARALAQDTIPHTTQDSLLFAAQVRQWQALPTNKDSLYEWQVATVLAVLEQKSTALQSRYAADFMGAADARTRAEEQWNAAKTDTTFTKDSVKVLGNFVKAVKKRESAVQADYKKTENLQAQIAKARTLPAKAQRKQMPKLYGDWQKLEDKYTALHAPPVVAPPPPPPVVEAPPPVTPEAAPEETPTDSTEQGDSKIGQLKKKLKPKEKAPALPQPARYDPKQDVMVTPPALPCRYGVERKDPFTGAVYRETDKSELFRFSNAVMKKVLPEHEAHIVCRAALATDGSSDQLLLEFTIKDANARRTFGGLAPKSILTLRFLDGEAVTLFNEANEEIQFDPEKGTAVFRGVYPFPKSALRKMEKADLDQVRVAWSAGYEDYNVHHVALFQHLSNCIK